MTVRYVPYTIALHSPLLLADVGGDPNSSRSVGYIPGAAIRGAVARRVGDPDHTTGARGVFDRLILGGKVRYLNAYPLIGSSRAFPRPLSILEEKDDPSSIHDLAALSDWPEEPLKPLEAAFVTLDTATLAGGRATFEGAVHQQRDREVGRAWKDEDGSGVGAIFNYESLSRGQRFAGVLLLEEDDPAALSALQTELEEILRDGDLLLGRSRRSEYGGEASVAFAAAARSRELTADIRQVEGDGDEFRCVLLSRYLGRDESTGQPDPRAIESEIVASLGGAVEVVRRFCSFAVVGGYNRKWRLQLPQSPVLEPGSVLILRSLRPIGAETLQSVENAGLGERRIEGFGRIAFLPIEDARPAIAVSNEDPHEILVEHRENPPALVLEMQRALVQSHVEREVDRLAASLANTNARSIPSPALLARLRTPMRRGAAGLAEMTEWLDEHHAHRLKQRAREPLQKCHLADERRSSLAAWLARTAAGGPALPESTTTRIAQRVHIVSEASARSVLEDPQMDATMRVRLIDGTLAALIRRRKLAE